MALPLPKGYRIPEEYSLHSRGVSVMTWKPSDEGKAKAAEKFYNREIRQDEHGKWWIKNEAVVAPELTQ